MRSGLEEKLVERRNTGVCELGEVKGDETWNGSLRLLQYVTYTICYICLFMLGHLSLGFRKIKGL